MPKSLTRLLLPIALGAAVLLVSCGGDDDKDPTPVLTPSATASPTPEGGTGTPPEPTTPAPASPTTAPATATPTPPPSQTPGADCPIDAAVCDFAAMLDAALQSGDYGAIADLMQAREWTCPGGTAQGAGGPFPLCDGAASGEVRSGYQLARRYSEGWITDYEGVITFIESFVDASSASESDAHGTGEVRLQAVGCVEGPSSGCSEATVIFTAILDGTHREVLVFSVALPIDAETPISLGRNGILLDHEEAPIFETGGAVSGLGEVYVLE